MKQFMTKEGIVSFQLDDYVDDVKDVMARRDSMKIFPILDEDGNFLGFISRRRLLNSQKQVIVVDQKSGSGRCWSRGAGDH